MNTNDEQFQLSISFIPSQENSSNSTTLTFSLLDDYRLDLSIRSLVGSRSRLQDVPKIAQLIESRIHSWIDERCVEPKFQQIVLPSLWPRKRTTREHAGAEGEAGITGDGQGQTTSSEGSASMTGSLRRRQHLAATLQGSFGPIDEIRAS